MFERKNETYNFNPQMVQSVLKCPTSPLCNIANAIPKGAKVLDIGAGNGILGCLLKELGKNATINAIEPSAHACEIIKSHNCYGEIFNGFAENYFEKISNTPYTHVVMADLLEHLINPLEFLQTLKTAIDKDCTLLCSIPNVAFGAVRLELMAGNFDYVDSGLLEATHLRFFTLKSIKELFEKANIPIQSITYLKSKIFNAYSPKIEAKNFPKALIYFVEKDELAHVYQFLVQANQNCASQTKILKKENKKWPFQF